MRTLRGRPGSPLWLMGHEFRLFWRSGEKAGRAGLVFALLLLAGWMWFSYTVMSRLGPSIPPPPLGMTPVDALVLVTVMLTIGLMASLMLSQSILAAIDAIYTRNDLDLLMSSPLKPWTVLIVRTMAIAFRSLPIYVFILSPPILWLAIFSSPIWLFSLAFIVVLAFAATGLALLVVTGLFRLLGPKRTRVLAQVTAAIVGASIFLGFQAFNIYGNGGRGRGDIDLAALTEGLTVPADALWLLPARAMTADPLPAMVWIAFSAALFFIGVNIFSRRFVHDAAAAASMGVRSKVRDERVPPLRGGLMASIIRKEVRLILRDPLLLSQVGLQLVYLLPIAFLLVRPGEAGGFRVSMEGFAPALAILSSALAGSLVWITVSAEDAPDLVASAPATRNTINRAKIIATMGLTLCLVSIPVMALATRDLVSGAWALTGAVIAAASASHIGLWRSIPASRRDFVRKRPKGSVTTMIGQSVTAILIAGAVGFAVYGLPWLALIPGIFAAASVGVLYRKV